MTTPTERTRAVVELAREVQALAPYMHGSSETVRVPREALRRLHAWLRHYPMPSELDMTARLAPELWGPTNPTIEPDQQCGLCCGTGRMVRDPDIGTDQECFVCNGSGRNEDLKGTR